MSALAMLTPATDSPLIWHQPRAFVNEYALSSGDHDVAALHWPHACGSLAEGCIGDEIWTFKRVGFWRPAVTIRQPRSGEQDVGRLHFDWRRGGLLMSGGGSYRWEQLSFWKSEWAFSNATGTNLVAFVPQPGFFTMPMEVRIDPEEVSCPDVPVMVLLGWYLLVMASQDDSAAVVTAVIS